MARTSMYKDIRIIADPAAHEEGFKLAKAVLKPGARILDIGAGAGAFAARLSDAGFQVDANDIDQQSWKASGIHKTSFDLNLPLPQAMIERGPYDMVAAIEIIEHLESPRKFLRDCKALLKPDGHLLVSTPNTANAYSRILFFRKTLFHWFSPEEYGEIGHITLLPPWLFERHVSSVGLTVVNRSFVGWAVKPRVSLKGLLWRAIVPVLKLGMIRSGRGELTRDIVLYLLRNEESAR